MSSVLRDHALVMPGGWDAGKIGGPLKNQEVKRGGHLKEIGIGGGLSIS